jgi:hypothetical protein
MKNIHVLVENKHIKNVGDLVKDQYTDIHRFTKNDGKEYGKTTTKLNIYITSDEEIKEGDYVYRDSGIVFKMTQELLEYYESRKDKDTHKRYKIILTTDQDLIKDGVQEISDEFLEWFVKNPSCEIIEVEKVIWNGVNDFEYRIIIPKEESKQPKVLSENGNELFFDEQGYLIREESSQETLPTKWFKVEQISTWIGAPITTEGKALKDLDGGHGILIVNHQCGENKLSLIGQLETMIYRLKNGSEAFNN